VNVTPITSRKPGRKIYPNEVLLSEKESGLDKESIALCHQIRTIDKVRLSKKYGQIDSLEIKKKVIEAVCFQLGISGD
jgi:mRNA interferase MazF